MDFGFIAGMGWGTAFGLAVALSVALWPRGRLPQMPSPPREGNVKRWPDFGGSERERERA